MFVGHPPDRSLVSSVDVHRESHGPGLFARSWLHIRMYRAGHMLRSSALTETLTSESIDLELAQHGLAR